jgi:hypothetical protein
MQGTRRRKWEEREEKGEVDDLILWIAAAV